MCAYNRAWSLGCEKSPSPGGYLSYEVLLSFDQSENSMTRIMLHVGRLLLDRQGCVILGSFGEISEGSERHLGSLPVVQHNQP